MKSKVQIIQDEQKPHAVEIIADAIVRVSAAMKKINQTRLTRDALVTLIARNSHIGREDIATVLNNLDELENRWLKKPVIAQPNPPKQ